MIEPSEIVEINQITARYQENVPTSKAEIQKVDPLPVLYKLHERLNDKASQIGICTREPVCDCDDVCDCDSDVFVNVSSTKADLASNCVFIFEFRCHHQETFNHLKHKSLRKKILRVFAISKDNDESTLLDIVRASPGHVILPDGRSFDLADDMLIEDRTITMKLNYMSFSASCAVSHS